MGNESVLFGCHAASLENRRVSGAVRREALIIARETCASGLCILPYSPGARPHAARYSARPADASLREARLLRCCSIETPLAGIGAILRELFFSNIAANSHAHPCATAIWIYTYNGDDVTAIGGVVAGFARDPTIKRLTRNAVAVRVRADRGDADRVVSEIGTGRENSRAVIAGAVRGRFVQWAYCGTPGDVGATKKGKAEAFPLISECERYQRTTVTVFVMVSPLNVSVQ